MWFFKRTPKCKHVWKYASLQQWNYIHFKTRVQVPDKVQGNRYCTLCQKHEVKWFYDTTTSQVMWKLGISEADYKKEGS